MAKAQSNKTTTGVKHPTLGFGVPASSDPHHFKVIIPKSSTGKVQISEYLGLQAQSEEFSVVDRVQLDRTRWTAIRAEVQRAFNARLKSYGLETSSWQVGENMLDRLLGKEICVLAWAIEGMEIDNIPVAVRNWLALSPEERWWLFGMTAKSTGGLKIAMLVGVLPCVTHLAISYKQSKYNSLKTAVSLIADIYQNHTK